MSVFDLDLSQLYGEYYTGEKFNPGTRNLRTGACGDKNRHHCSDCQTPPTKRCFISLHFAFCICKVETEGGKLEICGERFTVTSPGGCGKHPYKSHDENRIFQEAKRGNGKKLTCFSGKPEQDTLKQAIDDCEGLGSSKNGNKISAEELEEKPWLLYAKQPQFREKSAPRTKTKGASRMLQAPDIKTVIRSRTIKTKG